MYLKKNMNSIVFFAEFILSACFILLLYLFQFAFTVLNPLYISLQSFTHFWLPHLAATDKFPWELRWMSFTKDQSSTIHVRHALAYVWVHRWCIESIIQHIHTSTWLGLIWIFALQIWASTVSKRRSEMKHK